MRSNLTPIRSPLSGVAPLLLGNGLLNTLPSLRDVAGSCSSRPLALSWPGVRPAHAGQPWRPAPCDHPCLRRSRPPGERHAQFTARPCPGHTMLKPIPESPESAVDPIPEPTGEEHTREEARI